MVTLLRALRLLVLSEWHGWWIKHHAARYARHRRALFQYLGRQ